MNAPAPDTQFHVAALQFVDEGLADPDSHGVTAIPCLLTPESRGSVSLGSGDPMVKPIVRNNFYSTESDMRRAIDGLRLLLEICAQPALRRYCATPFNVPEGDSDEALRAHLARTTFALYHPVGTCSIGSVVDVTR